MSDLIAPSPGPSAADDSGDAAPVRFVTLGCRLNTYDSDVMAPLVVAAGLGPTVVINTCAVTAEAVRQARQEIRRARRADPGARIVVTGCAAQIEPETFAAMPEVDHVLGNAEKLQASSYRALGDQRVMVGDIMGQRTTPALTLPTPGPGARTRAHVQVQTGCDHRCTFCVIPFGRGNARSVPPEEVVGQIAALADAQVPEVVLTGVDLTSWGGDLPGKPALGQLVGRILTLVPHLKRLRLSSLDVIELDPQLFAHITTNPRVQPYLHLSLQHGHDLILKRMKRRHSVADAMDLMARLRAARPDIAFGADIIAGFPTETEEHAEATRAFVAAAGIAFLHVFPYSPRAGTPAARMPQLPRDVIKARAAALRAVGADLLARHLDTHVGRTVDALVERPGSARLDDFTPVALIGGRAGERRTLRISGHDGTRLLAGA